ncbi:MAG: diguanylate cyclase domain-containing protein [Pseudomonadota bacterium]
MLVSSKHHLDKVLDLLIDTVCVVDAEGRFVFISASCEDLLGYTQEELIGRNMVDLVLPEDRERTLQAATTVMDGNPLVHFENRYVRKDGGVVDIMWSARWSEADRLRFAVARDITELKHAERKHRALYDISEAAHSTQDLEGLYLHIHRVIDRLLPADLLFAAQYNVADHMLSFPYFSGDVPQKPEPQPLGSGSRLAKVIHSGQALLLSGSDSGGGPAAELAGIEDYRDWLVVPLLSPQGAIGALVMARRAGSVGYTERDKDLLQFVSVQVATAIERKHAEQRLRHTASHDPLTDLPNRMLFQDRFEMALKRAQRDREKVALIYLDLNEFKQVNDSFGHQFGDLFLCEIAQRLSGCVRESDTVGRMGGDEFAVLVTNALGPESGEAVMEKIRAEIERPVVLGGRTLRPSASIGAAFYPDQGTTTHELIRHADEGMYHAKRDRLQQP